MAESTNHLYLAKNMGTRVEMPDRFYGRIADEDWAAALSKSGFGAAKETSGPDVQAESGRRIEKMTARASLKVISGGKITSRFVGWF